MSESPLRSFQPYAQSLLRIVAGFISMEFGLNKLLGIFMPAVKAGTILWYAGVIESVGGGLMILGLLTVPVAFIMSGQMAVAYFMAHAPAGVFIPAKNMGTPAVLFCFIYLYFVFAGPGPLSLDSIIPIIFRERRTA